MASIERKYKEDLGPGGGLGRWTTMMDVSERSESTSTRCGGRKIREKDACELDPIARQGTGNQRTTPHAEVGVRWEAWVFFCFFFVFCFHAGGLEGVFCDDTGSLRSGSEQRKAIETRADEKGKSEKIGMAAADRVGPTRSLLAQKGKEEKKIAKIFLRDSAKARVWGGKI